MHIQPARLSDLPQILSIYENARSFMAQKGNPTQWINGYPDRAVLENDIALNRLFICQKNSLLEAVFMFRIGDDPTYSHIEDGGWKNDRIYGTIHRLASAGRIPRLADFCIRWCADQCALQNASLRGDTHADNLPMQDVFARNGFLRCGVIYTDDGSPRIAFRRG